MTYANKKENGNNGQARQYRVLNETFRIYLFLKNNKGEMFTISDITKILGSYKNTSHIKPKLLFLIKLDLIEIVKPQRAQNKSNTTKYYKFKQNGN
jgi:hypothetical protein